MRPLLPFNYLRLKGNGDFQGLSLPTSGEDISGGELNPQAGRAGFSQGLTGLTGSIDLSAFSRYYPRGRQPRGNASERPDRQD